MQREEYEVVGKPVERTDGRVKATGKAKYAGDLVAPGMLDGTPSKSIKFSLVLNPRYAYPLQSPSLRP
jgi:CO/xanthine dehydrogenase Mo-binding subunit